VWKVFTNCDIPSNHLISIDFRIHHLPCITPCVCNAPTCAVTLPDPHLSTCSVINRTHVLRKQAQLLQPTATPTHEAHQPPKSRTSTTSQSGVNLSQQKLSRYFPTVDCTSSCSLQLNRNVTEIDSINPSTSERTMHTVMGIGSAVTNVALQRSHEGRHGPTEPHYHISCTASIRQSATDCTGDQSCMTIRSQDFNM
jgi:hypothetical protein